MRNAQGTGRKIRKKSLGISRMNSKFGSTVTHMSLCSKQHYNGSYQEALENIQTFKESEMKIMKWKALIFHRK